ncbi:hypothetical protein NHQ30_007807 [Ciborinia camelliae]|nr:hypothetical protein NHQ30_007807 [Ciborinia camelliae]
MALDTSPELYYEKYEPYEKYLEASKGWAPVSIGKDWVGTKYLGGGSYGMATLFEYKGDDPNVEPRQIVVKQEGDGKSLKDESRMLQRLMEYESNHIIKIYRAYHRTMGTGTDEKMDPAILLQAFWLLDDEREAHDKWVRKELAKRDPWGEASRIYLECASNGDLDHWLRENCDDLHPSEEFIFRLWECLLRGLMVLKHGTENWRDDLDYERAKHWHSPIAHFDIKPANILVGDHPKPGHERIRVHKFADFGFALEVPDPDMDEEERKEWLLITRGRNTFHAPEQRYEDHPNPDIGLKTDLWNVAHVIYMCLNKNQPARNNIHFTTGVDPEPSFSFKTMGMNLVDGSREIYSRKLRGMLLRALAYDPAQRWELEELLEMVEHVLEHWNFGDETDLFLEGIQGEHLGWSKFPDIAGDEESVKAMQVTDVEYDYTLGPFSVPTLYSRPNRDLKEDEYDFGGVRLLFPTRKDVSMGFREWPFEFGVAKRPLPRFPDWRRVGRDGKPIDSDEEEEEEDVEMTEGIVPGKIGKLLGTKRMRSAQEQEEGEVTATAATRGLTPPRPRRRKFPERTPTGITGMPERRRYFYGRSGGIISRHYRRTPMLGDEDYERSAPWIREDPIAFSFQTPGSGLRSPRLPTLFSFTRPCPPQLPIVRPSTRPRSSQTPTVRSLTRHDPSRSPPRLDIVPSVQMTDFPDDWDDIENWEI